MTMTGGGWRMVPVTAAAIAATAAPVAAAAVAVAASVACQSRHVIHLTRAAMRDEFVDAI